VSQDPAAKCVRNRIICSAAWLRTVNPSEGAANEGVRRAAPLLEHDHLDRRCGAVVDDIRPLAGLADRFDRQEKGLSQRPLQRDHPRRALFPRRQRVHADLRSDAQRQPGAWLALSPRRIPRLRRRRLDRLLAARLPGGLHPCGRFRNPSAGCRVPPDGGAGPAPNAGHHRHLHRHGGSDVVDLGRRLLQHQHPELAERADADILRHGGEAIDRRSDLP